MQSTLLQTKLNAPRPRVKSVARPRLVEKLDESQNRKLTLISAPAGFGKTTLLTEWIDAASKPIAWLSLDSGENDSVRFLTYATASLRMVEPDLGQGTLGLIDAPQQPPLEALAAALLNDIASRTEEFVLILDDCHQVEAQPTYDLLGFLLDHMPGNLHLVMSGRVDPPLPLAHLRAQSQLTEIRANDLRFSSDETAAFLNDLMGLQLPDSDIAVMSDRTEGWIAGLQLAALSLQGREDSEKSTLIQSFSGSHRFIMDYLVDEVLSQQTEQTQAFLCRTSILNRFCAPLCDHTLEISNSQSILEELEHQNLFLIALDDERNWYRYHHLFADFLRLRLDSTEPERTNGLHRRASEWYLKSGFAEEAVQQALSAEETSLAAELLEDLAETYWKRGEPSTLLRWIKLLPRNQIKSRPGLCIHYAWVLRTNGEYYEAEKMLQAAEHGLATKTDHLTPEAQRELEARIAAIRAAISFWQGEAESTEQHAQRALELFPDSSSMWRSLAAMSLGMAQDLAGDTVAACDTVSMAVEYSRASGNTYLTLSTGLHLGALLITRGDLKEADRVLQQAHHFAKERGVLATEMAGCMYDELGLIHCEWNELDRAADYLKLGSALSEEGFDVGVLAYSYVAAIRDLFARGNLKAAQDAINSMDLLETKTPILPWYTSLKESWRVRIWLKLNDIESAATWARIRELEMKNDPFGVMEEEQIAVLRVQIAQGRFEEANELLEQLLARALDGGRNANAGQMLMLLALMRKSMGDVDGSMQALAEALSKTEPGGYIRAYLDEGEDMHQLLLEAESRGLSPHYVGALLAAIEAEQLEKKHPSSFSLPEPLTERELQVLKLLASELSGPEIASELSVSANTMRTHTRSIYGKLNAHNRRQALRIAEDLELL